MPRGPLAAALLVACATTTHPATPPAEHVLDSGGELTISVLPPRTVEVTGEQLEAFAMTEVPGDSRLQAAFAMADALARAELVKAVRVGVASVLLEHEDQQSRLVSQVEAEVARGVLPGLAPPEHRWIKVEHDGTVTLRVIARVLADRSAVADAVTRSLDSQPGGSDLARRAVAVIGQAVSP